MLIKTPSLLTQALKALKLERKPQLYLAGAMTGLPGRNYPAFARGAEFFERYLGKGSVINPAGNYPLAMGELKRQGLTIRTASPSQIYDAFMSVSERQVKETQLTVAMGAGVFGSKAPWQVSKGAMLEEGWANIFYSTKQPRGPSEVVEAIRQSYPQYYGEFHTMKPHPPTFPGGRAQPLRQETFAEETERLRMQARTPAPLLKFRRGRGRPIMAWPPTPLGPPPSPPSGIGATGDDIVRTVVDMEAQGLRGGRAAEHHLRVSELAYQTHYPSRMLQGLTPEQTKAVTSPVQRYTNIIFQAPGAEAPDPKLFERFGITAESTGALQKGRAVGDMTLPEEFVSLMSKKTAGKAGYWDIGISVRNNPIYDIFRRHVQEGLKHPDQMMPEADVVREMLESLVLGPRDQKGHRLAQLGLKGTKLKREVTAWNLTYDWGNIRAVAMSTENRAWGKALMDDLLNARAEGRFNWIDSRTRWSEFVFNMMEEDRGWVPPYFSPRKMDVLRGKLAPGAAPTTEQIMGIAQDHKALRSFLDDFFMAGTQKGNQVWKERFAGWTSRANPFDRKAATYVVDVLERASKEQTFSSWERAMSQLKSLPENVRNIFSEEKIEQIIGSVYPTPEPHMSVLGKASRYSLIEEGLLDTALGFVRGSRLSNLAGALSGIKNEAGKDAFPEIVKILSKPQALDEAHVAVFDQSLVMPVRQALETVNAPGANKFVVDRVRQAVREESYVAAGVLERLMQDVPSQARMPATAPTPAGAVFLEKLPQWFKREPKVALAGLALGASALYLMAANGSSGYVEGQRQADSQWREVEGIRPSGDMRSDFGSGRNIVSQLLGTPYNPQVQWLAASSIGMRGDQLYRSIIEQSEGESLSKGSWVGRAVADAMGGEIAGSEWYVEDPNLGIHGYIDILLKGGIPLEVKTVADVGALKGLKGPKPSAVSQANFYAYAMGAPYGYVAYFAREDPSKYRLFRVDVDRQRLMIDRQVALEAYEAAIDAGAYRVKTGGQARILSERGFEKVFSSFKNAFVGFEPLTPNYGLYPRAQNPYDSIPRIGEYGKYKLQGFRGTGHGGRVQQMHYDSHGSKIRDQRTRLQRVQPLVAQTSRASRPVNVASRCEVR